MGLTNDGSDEFHDLLTSKAQEYRNKLNKELDDHLFDSRPKEKLSLLSLELGIVTGVYLILIPCKVVGLIPISWGVIITCGIISMFLPVLLYYKNYRRGKKNE